MEMARMGLDELEEAAVLYECGLMNQKQLAMRYGVHASTIGSAMKKMGVRHASMVGKPMDPTSYQKRIELRAATYSKTFAQVAVERREAHLQLVGEMMKVIMNADEAGELSAASGAIERIADARGIRTREGSP